MRQQKIVFVPFILETILGELKTFFKVDLYAS